MKPQLHGQLIYNIGGKNIQWGNDSFPINGAGKLDSYMQKNQTGLISYTIHKNKFKMD